MGSERKSVYEGGRCHSRLLSQQAAGSDLARGALGITRRCPGLACPRSSWIPTGAWPWSRGFLLRAGGGGGGLGSRQGGWTDGGYRAPGKRRLVRGAIRPFAEDSQVGCTLAARRLGVGAHQHSWKMVFKIICSRKRRRGPGIGEALGGSREECDEGQGC